MDPNATISPQAARRFSGGVTAIMAARKETKARKAAESPVRAIVYEVCRKGAGIAATAGAVLVWQAHATQVRELTKLNPQAETGHFEQYVAIGLLALAVYLFFPDVFHGFLGSIRPLLPWGKKAETP